MFYFLHRLVKWVFMAMIAGVLYWAWLQREALEPAYVWFDVYKNGGLMNDKSLHTIQGRAVYVVDGHTFQMKEDGRSLTVRLTGLQLPEPPLSQTEIQLEKERRKFLREALVLKDVEVQVTAAVTGGRLGIVSLNGTNLNLYFITNGLGKFNPTYVKNLPREVQYQFFAAERVHERESDRKTELASVQ